ncbi:hypothetical protein F383_05104 [Gossypium arboreum]|nr:hypothetical protein F383_05104 [Gossypium arboreum]
MVYWWR